nr:attachment glycoprotein G - ovine respiratory syncytial virus ORSV [Ovine respiratory syncytial virus]
MSNHTHHFEFKTLKKAWKASKYFIVGLSCLYKLNLKSLVQMALSALAMITLVSLTITAIIYISTGNTKAKPMPTPTIQITQQFQNHISLPPTEHNHNSTHSPTQGTTSPHTFAVDVTEGTAYYHLTHKTQGGKTKGPPTPHATRKPPISSQKSNPSEIQQDYSDFQILPYVPCNICEGDSACLSLCQDRSESILDKALTTTPKKTPKPMTTKKPTKTSTHHRTSLRNKLYIKTNMTTPPHGLISTAKHNKNQSTVQNPRHTLA